MRRRANPASMAVVACALLVMFACALGFSQSRGQQSPPGPQQLPLKQDSPNPSRLRVASRLVQVSVIVQDKDGHAVTGLTKDDFTVLDQGQRQQIASFSEQINRLSTTSAAAPPNHFSNRFVQHDGGQSPLTVIVIDSFNTRYFDVRGCPPFCPGRLGIIFNEVEKFISQMQARDRVALYEFADRLYLLQDFTSDPGSVERGLNRGRDYVSNLHYSVSQTDSAEMSARTMGAMQEIADRLANVPGRKNLIWLSTGFPRQRAITDEKMDKAAKMLGNSDLPLSAISARGLEAPNASAAATGAPGGPLPGGGNGGDGGGKRPSPGGPPTPAQVNGDAGTGGGRTGGFDYLRNLAEASGGRAFYNTNGLAGSIRRVIDDSSTTYLLGYYPDHNKWNGEFREIKVKVNRPGVEIRSRSWLLRCRGHRFRSEEVCPAIGSGNPQPTRINGPWNGCTRGCD